MISFLLSQLISYRERDAGDLTTLLKINSESVTMAILYRLIGLQKLVYCLITFCYFTIENTASTGMLLYDAGAESK